MKRFCNLLFLTLFLCAIGIPLLSFMTGWPSIENVRENRQLAKPPEVKTALRPRRFTPQFDRFYADHFGLRPLLVSAYRYINQNLLQHSDKVIPGKQGWLFLARGSRPGPVRPLPILPDVCGGLPFIPEQFSRWVEVLTRNHNELANRGIAYLYVLIPNKHSIHGDKLPDHAQNGRCSDATQSRMQQLFTRLKNETGVSFVDMRDQLKTLASNGEQLFYKSDTHWNGNGMLAGYKSIINSMPTSAMVSDVSRAQAISQTTKNVRGGDLTIFWGKAANLVDTSYKLTFESKQGKAIAQPLPGEFKNPTRQPTTWSTGRSELSNSLIFHDSFFVGGIKELLIESFNESTFIWNSAPKINLDYVDKIKPNIVIHEMVERTLLQPYFLD